MVKVDYEKLEEIAAGLRHNNSLAGFNGFRKDFRVFLHNLKLEGREPEIWHHTERNVSAIEQYSGNGSVMQGLEVLGNRWFKDSIDLPPGYKGTISYIKTHHPDIDNPNYRVDLTEHTLVQSHIEKLGLEGKVVVIGIPIKNHQDSVNINFTCGPFVFYYLNGSLIEIELDHELAHAKSHYYVDKDGFYEEVWAQLAAGGDVRDIVSWLDSINPKFQKRAITKDLAKAIVLEERYKALKANQTMDGFDNRLLMCKNLNEALFELYVVNGYGNMAQTTGLFR